MQKEMIWSFRYIPTLLSPSSDYPNGHLAKEHCAIHRSKDLETIRDSNRNSWNKVTKTKSRISNDINMFRYVSHVHNVQHLHASPAWLAKIVFTERRVNCSAPAQDKLKCLREIQFLNSCQMSDQDRSSTLSTVPSCTLESLCCWEFRGFSRSTIPHLASFWIKELALRDYRLWQTKWNAWVQFCFCPHLAWASERSWPPIVKLLKLLRLSVQKTQNKLFDNFT